MALMPLPDGRGMPGSKEFSGLCLKLRRLAEIIGWGVTGAVGGLPNASAVV